MSKLSLYPITLDGTDIDKKRDEIKSYFHNTCELYEKVFELLKDDSVFYEKSEITRHPMIFYFGHTATFFINKLLNMKIISKRINPDFESIFAVGVDEMDWDDMNGSHYNWPEVDEVRAYRESVKVVVDNLIDTLPLALPIREDSAMWIILMGIEHERIHIETSLVLHRQMPLDLVKEIEEFSVCQNSATAPKNSMLDISTLDVELGKKKSHNLYGWDNEYGSFKERVESFKVSKYLVSNSEFMEFVQNGGYKNLEYWDREGRDFLALTGATHPPFWVEVDGLYMYRTLSSLIEMPEDWPVDVNALEAEAFCRYISERDGVTYKLPSESEYRAIYDYSGLEDIPKFHESRANLNFYHYASSCPVNEFSFNGIYDVVGNVWQWSRTPIRAFEGFEVHEAYDDFSVPTFDEKHALILGSSWASSGNLIMKYSRYAFRKHFYQNAGFRYVISSQREDKIEDIYEHDALVAQYCEYDYSENSFAKTAISETVNMLTGMKKDRALDLGCKTGRTSFELANHYLSVTGVDKSARFIRIGSMLQKTQSGDLKCNLMQLGLEKVKNRVKFFQVDTCNIKQVFREYDIIFILDAEIFTVENCTFFASLDRLLNKKGVIVTLNESTYLEDGFASAGYHKVCVKEFQSLNIEKKVSRYSLTLRSKSE